MLKGDGKWGRGLEGEFFVSLRPVEESRCVELIYVSISCAAPSSQSRTLPLLISLLSPTSPTAPIPTHPLSIPPTSPLALQSLLLSLLRLTRTIASSTPGINAPQRSNTGGGARVFANQKQAPNQVGEREMLARLVGRVRRGEVVKLEREEVREVYGGNGTEGGAWDGRRVSEAVAWEGVVMSLGVGEGRERRGVLRGEVEVSSDHSRNSHYTDKPMSRGRALTMVWCRSFRRSGPNSSTRISVLSRPSSTDELFSSSSKPHTPTSFNSSPPPTTASISNEIDSSCSISSEIAFFPSSTSSRRRRRPMEETRLSRRGRWVSWSL